jgi:hypothetical protein
VARQAFLQLHARCQQAADLGVTAIFGGSSVTPSSAFQGPGIGRVVGDRLGQAVDLAVGHLQDATGVLEHGAQPSAFPKVMIRAIVGASSVPGRSGSLAAPRFAEIDVEIRHRRHARD